MVHPIKPCAGITGSDALLALALECANDVARDANCRVYAKDENEEYVIVKDCSPSKPEGIPDDTREVCYGRRR